MPGILQIHLFLDTKGTKDQPSRRVEKGAFSTLSMNVLRQVIKFAYKGHISLPPLVPRLIHTTTNTPLIALINIISTNILLVKAKLISYPQ